MVFDADIDLTGFPEHDWKRYYGDVTDGTHTLRRAKALGKNRRDAIVRGRRPCGKPIRETVKNGIYNIP